MEAQTYPINPKGQRAWKLKLISNIFKQLKYLGNKINDLPMTVRILVIRDIDQYGQHLVWSHVFDALYDQGTMYLTNMERELEKKVADRMNKPLQEYLKQV